MFKRIRTFLSLSTLAATLLVASPAFAAPTLEGQVNLNTATVEQLELLPGIGPAMAKKIVDYRANKPFQETNHIIRIKGIGPKTYAKFKQYLVLKGETTLREVPKDEQAAKP
ncbi:ComEA family DNA-binding protein [Nannocystis pusilla]|uniref:ComEA family DNA-binding protein n=1 Tax=Nannocystis pusilla TaxID=889268 RepID=A0ABS7U4D2_9BACT|nr:ComEA family DNA-binding protein [Nannocystis pusilla]MBZ5715422.1 ComEA family DNA-binding protein [Nannocystis pusilla]